MVRSAALFTCFILTPQFLLADPPSASDTRMASALAVQSALTLAKEHLLANKPNDAVKVLEAQILYVNGNSAFLALMKEAYIAELKQLKLMKGDPDRIDHVCRQLRTLDPKLNVVELAPTSTPPAQEETLSAEPVKAVETVAPTSPEPVAQPVPPSVKTKSLPDDPFQQAPLDRMPAKTDARNRARSAFEKKQYPEAAALFAEAQKAGVELSPAEKHAWSYCRLDSVVKKLAPGSFVGTSLVQMENETEEALKLGGPSLEKFGQQVLAEIRKRKGAGARPASTAIPEGWQTIESGSFRVFFQRSPEQANDVAKAAEQIRTATFEKWAGPAGAEWSPRCDVWLHQTGADYAKITEKPATSPGHSSIGLKDGKVMVRRVDLRLDEIGMMNVVLPREVAYVVVSDMFPEQPLPRWADVGMSIHAEPAGEVSRYRRAVGKLNQERKLFTVRELLRMADFPAAEKITPFYVESVSLVDYLVRLKGPKAFALYLREAPRRGYEEALERHYGFKNADELQERWLKFAMGSE